MDLGPPTVYQRRGATSQLSHPTSGYGCAIPRKAVGTSAGTLFHFEIRLLSVVDSSGLQGASQLAQKTELSGEISEVVGATVGPPQITRHLRLPSHAPAAGRRIEAAGCARAFEGKADGPCPEERRRRLGDSGLDHRRTNLWRSLLALSVGALTAGTFC